jgi:hypothetical protein
MVQQQNFYFEKVSEILGTAISEERLERNLQIILDSLKDERQEQNLTTNEFTLLGAFGYLFGIDYTSQVGGLTATVMTNVVARFKTLGVSPEAVGIYQEIIKVLDIKALDAPKDGLTNSVEVEIDIHPSALFPIKQSLLTVVNNTTFPVHFAVELNELKKRKTYTYQHMLKFNSMIYEQIELPGKYLDTLIKLYNNKIYKQILSDASARFDDQKFALIYFDSIHSIKEFNAKYSPDITPYIADNDMVIQLPTLYDAKPATDETATDAPTVITGENGYIIPKANREDADRFIKAVIEEKILKEITTAGTYIEGIHAIMNDQDLIASVYQYFKVNANKGRTPGNEVYGSIFENIQNAVTQEIETITAAFKELMEKYAAEIPEKYSNRIVKYTNDLIRSISITSAETKGYLMNQLSSNGITTWKHLHQMIGLIENCKIIGNMTEAYVMLNDYLQNIDGTFVVDLFADVQQLEAMQVQVSFLREVKKFNETVVDDTNRFVETEEDPDKGQTDYVDVDATKTKAKPVKKPATKKSAEKK